MNIGVFCGSSKGKDQSFSDVAQDLGKILGQSRHTLIYGGANIGLMGILADSVLLYGGRVVGVIPDFLVQKEVAHRGVSELIMVSSMHERKERMAKLSDVFIAMPGGLGTLDELAEILTWKQLQLITQPVGILNVNGFFNSLIRQMQEMTEKHFVSKNNLDQILISHRVNTLLTMLGVEMIIP